MEMLAFSFVFLHSLYQTTINKFPQSFYILSGMLRLLRLEQFI